MEVNTILIKSGTNKPTKTDLQDRELGFARKNERLYIGDNGKVVSVGSKIFTSEPDHNIIEDGDLWIDPSEDGSSIFASNTTPLVAGTADAGKETKYSRGDHIHPAQTTVSGNAGSATKLKTARAIDGVSFNGSSDITHYGVCETAAAIAAKTVSINGFSLKTGARVHIKFISRDEATSSPTLNINGTGAKAIMCGISKYPSGTLKAGKVYEFVYDGTYYQFVGIVEKTATSSAMGLMSSTDKEKLDNITSGEWTPTAGNWTINTAVGTYIKIGPLCILSFHVYGKGNSSTSNTDTPSYYFKISGLPFTPSSDVAFFGGGGHIQGAKSPAEGATFSGFTISTNDNSIYARTYNKTTNAGNYMIVSNGSANIYASGTIMYKIAEEV